MNIIFGIVLFILCGVCAFIITFLESLSDRDSSWIKEIGIMITQGIFAVLGIVLFVLSLAFFIPES